MIEDCKVYAVSKSEVSKQLYFTRVNTWHMLSFKIFQQKFREVTFAINIVISFAKIQTFAQVSKIRNTVLKQVDGWLTCSVCFESQ